MSGANTVQCVWSLSVPEHCAVEFWEYVLGYGMPIPYPSPSV